MQNFPLNRPWVVLPASPKLLLPVNHGLVLRVHKVLIDGVLVGEGALHLSQVVVNLLAAVLIHRAAQGPDHTELEPQLYHAHIVLSICGVHLHRNKGKYLRQATRTGIQCQKSLS